MKKLMGIILCMGFIVTCLALDAAAQDESRPFQLSLWSPVQILDEDMAVGSICRSLLPSLGCMPTIKGNVKN